jgi:putative ABC transport system substrate-binding protein
MPRAYIVQYQEGLSDYGYIDGRTAIVQTFAAMTIADLPAVAAQAASSGADVIVVNDNTVATTLKRFTQSVPVVFGGAGDPIAEGLTMSLAYPTANFTGISIVAPDLLGKQLGVLKRLVAGLKRIVVLNPVESSLTAISQIPAAARDAGIDAILVDIVEGKDFASQFQQVIASSPQAMYAPASLYLKSISSTVADQQIEHRPLLWNDAMTEYRALLGYGPNLMAGFRKTGAYVDAILKGSQVRDLPIQQPTVFDLAINLTTAKALGITIPPSVLAQATIVAE